MKTAPSSVGKIRPTVRSRLDDVMARLESKLDKMTSSDETKRIAEKLDRKCTRLAQQAFTEEELNEEGS